MYLLFFRNVVIFYIYIYVYEDIKFFIVSDVFVYYIIEIVDYIV